MCVFGRWNDPTATNHHCHFSIWRKARTVAAAVSCPPQIPTEFPNFNLLVIYFTLLLEHVLTTRDINTSELDKEAEALNEQEQIFFLCSQLVGTIKPNQPYVRGGEMTSVDLRLLLTPEMGIQKGQATENQTVHTVRHREPAVCTTSRLKLPHLTGRWLDIDSKNLIKYILFWKLLGTVLFGLVHCAIFGHFFCPKGVNINLKQQNRTVTASPFFSWDTKQS